jgi:hypothetical protein
MTVVDDLERGRVAAPDQVHQVLVGEGAQIGPHALCA